MDSLAALHFEEIGRQLSLVSEKEARFSKTPDRRLGAAACETFHAVWLWLSVTIAAFVQPGAKNCSIQQTQSRLGIRNHRGDGLIYFMGHRSGEPYHRDAVRVRQLRECPTLEATDVVQRVIHAPNRMSAILYGSAPYICAGYFLASGEVTGRAFDRSREHERKTFARIILRCLPASLNRHPLH